MNYCFLQNKLPGGLSCVLSLMCWSMAADSNNDVLIEEVLVYGEQQETNTATRLDLSVLETPQSVAVISLPQMQDFALNGVNELLRYTPGITVEAVETDRSYYTARGFDVVNFQYDGIGVPFSAGLSHGRQDTAVYEQVEVVKGAAGLITGLANPSATVNYIRKRPADELNGSVDLLAGDEERYRLQGDISVPVSDTVRGRLVAAKDKADSYLDRREEDVSLLYGVFDIELGSDTVVTLGYSKNKSDSSGSMSGALPLYYSDGSQTDYAVSTSTAADWAFRKVDSSQSFVELKHHLNENWSLTALLTYNDMEMVAEELYVYGTPERTTEMGLSGQAFRYELEEEQRIADVFVSGDFEFGGRQHALVIGLNYADIDLFGQSYYDYTNGFPVLDGDWATGNTPRPDFVDYDRYTSGHKDEQEHKSLYAATRLKLHEKLALLLGARYMKVDQKGYNYGTDVASDAEETVPYLGLTYDLTDDIAFYGSYSEVFTPQSFVATDFGTLGVAEGDNAELGVKVALNDGRATASLAVFQSNLENLGEFVEVVGGVNTYTGLDYETNGAEFELIGSVSETLNVSFGYTYLHEVIGDDGEDVRTYIPRKTLKLAAAWDVPYINGLRLGGSLNWQDRIYTEPAAGVRVEQGGYTVINTFVRYQASRHLSLALNINNLGDKKYLNSLYWTQGFYAAPRQVEVSARWHFY
ncbi:MAG: TonB-dependent siderophore receptor [Parahaliea sp.]